MDFKKFQIEEFEFVEDFYKKKRGRLFVIIISLVNTSTGNLFVPLALKNSKRDLGVKSLDLLLKRVDLPELMNEDAVKHHDKRLFSRIKIVYSVFIFSLLLLVAVTYLTASLFWKLVDAINISLDISSHNKVLATLTSAIIAVVSIIILFAVNSLVARFSLQLGMFLTNKRYANSICINVVIFLVIMLAWDDVLSHPLKKKKLLIQINLLTRVTTYLSFSQFTKSEANKTWTRMHFRQMRDFIRERERWVLAPVDTTLSDLRRDFYELAKIYISGDYGKFKWNDAARKEEEPKTPLIRSVLSFLPRFLGLVLPLIAIGYVLVNQNYLPAGFDPSLVWLVFVAWILLSIDATLKLGVVSGIISLAKEIKNLK